MCLAVPSKIVKIENGIGTIEVGGVEREASLMLLDDPKVGEYVIVHAGFAINRIDEAEALETLKAIREVLSLSDFSGSDAS